MSSSGRHVSDVRVRALPRKVLGAAFFESEPSSQEQLRGLEQENCSLAALVCNVGRLAAGGRLCHRLAPGAS